MEARIQEAIDGIRKGKFKWTYHAAKVLDLSAKIPHKRMTGGKSRTHAQANHQALIPAEEIALV